MSRRIVAEVLMVYCQIRRSQLLGTTLLLAIATAAPATAQTPLADLRDLKPRQTKADAFVLSAPQAVRIEAVGEAGDLGDRSYTVLKAIWNGRADERARPWVGNAWILDLRSRKVVWELSGANTAGRDGARVFSGSVQLPPGSYAAYVSAFPSGYSTEGDGPGAQVTRWLGADHLAEYKLTVLGSGQRLTTADVERLRQQASANAVINLRGTSAERYQQAGFVLDRAADVEVYSIGERAKTASSTPGGSSTPTLARKCGS